MSSGRTPTREQAAAAASRDRDVFLEAGAGSGKTGVLVERYCAAVADDGISPESILAFTFTEKAAAELRRRIRAELERLAAEGSGEEAERLSEAVRSLGAAPITTIHGFCRRLLASHPIAAGLDPRFRVLDESESRRVAWTAFDSALEDFTAVAGPEGEHRMALLSTRRARQIVLRAHEELVSRGDEPALPPVTPRDLGAALTELGQAAEPVAVNPKRTETQRERAAAAIALAEAGTATLHELEAVELESKSTVEEVDAFRQAARRAIAVAAEGGAGGATYADLGVLLELFSKRFAAAKSERSGLDFEDLQRGAVALLGGSPEIGTATRERFTHILVDEFQDTNALQLALIEGLRGPDTKLFCVGDEFQSIYGFRHADIDIFTGQRRAFEERAGAESMRLSGNFRSGPQIVATVNEFGNALLPGYSDLTAGRDTDSRAPVELLLTDAKGWKEHRDALAPRDGDKTAAEAIAEARILAGRLREIADAGEHRPDQMVILLRAFTQVEAFEEALTRAGLPAYVVGGGGYWSRQQAQDMVALLSAIANPLDDEALFGALASPAGGVAPDTLWLLRRIAGGRHIWHAMRTVAGEVEPDAGNEESETALAAIPGEDRGRVAELAATLRRLRDAGTRLSLESLLQRAVEETGYDLAVLRADHGRERYANVRKMMRLARDFESVEGRDLRGFLDYAALSAEQDAEAPAAVEAEEGSGVRIMTVHAAKGLEFPLVAVAQLGRALRTGGSADLVLGRPGETPLRAGMRMSRPGAGTLALFDYEDLVREGIDREEAEELRLAYVAVTRARDRLILSGARTETNHTDERALSVLRRMLHRLGASGLTGDATLGLRAADPLPESGRERETNARIHVAYTAPSEDSAAALAERRKDLSEAPSEPESPPPLVTVDAPALPARTLSYSTLQEHARCGYRFYVERVLRLGSVDAGFGEAEPSRNRALQIGNATHELLRRSAESRWAAPGPTAVAGALARAGLEPADTSAADRVTGSVLAWLGSPLPGGLRGAGVRLRAEHPFLLDVDGTVVRGSIDLLAERATGAPLVVDYKTDRLRGDDPAERAERYRTQRNVYAVAVAEALDVDEVEVAYVFLERPEEPARVTLGAGELAAARADLEGAVGAIAAGSFEVTAEPSWPLCSDCPARKRLCPAPATRDQATPSDGP